MSKLRLSESLTLPLDAVTQTFGILAVRGAGKSNCAAVMAEEMYRARLPFVVIDPVGSWFGLRSSRDGRKPGLPIPIFGGDHGDIPLERGNGHDLADLIAEKRLSCILDLIGFSEGDKVRFLTDFAERLYRRNRQPLHLFLEEADDYCLTEDTEILSTQGWIPHHHIQEGTVVAAYNPDDDQCAWEPVQRIMRRDYSGDMVALMTKNLSCTITPDHRVVLRRFQHDPKRFKWYPWEFREAQSLPVGFEIPAVRRLPQENEIPGLSPEVCRILGWLTTDGYAHDRSKSRALGIQQSVGTVKGGRRIVNEMDAVLSRFGASRYDRPRRQRNSESLVWYIPEPVAKQWLSWLEAKHLPLKTERRIPRRLLERSSTKQLEALYLGLLEGDGTWQERRGWVAFYPGLNEGLADDFQEVCTRLGISTAKRFIPSNGQWHVKLSRRTEHYIKHASRAFYEGTVWDVTVPSGAFIARRCGQVFITGNCPQKPRREQARLLGAWQNIVRRGRSRGLGITMITQRSAVVNKDVLTQIGTLIVLRTTSPWDRKAIEAWVKYQGEKADILSSLAGLNDGEAWVWSPNWLRCVKRVKIRRRSTFDSAATPTTAAARPPATLADIDVPELRERFSATIERAKAEDPRELRREIARLRRELAAAQKATPVPEVKRVEVPVLTERAGRALQASAKEIEKVFLRMETVITRTRTDLRQLSLDVQQAFAAAPLPGEPVVVRPQVVRPLQDQARGQRPAASPANNGDLSHIRAGARRMLEAMARRHPSPSTWAQIRTLARLAKSGTFATYQRDLRRAGLIEDDGREVRLSDAGLEFVGHIPRTPQTPEEILDMWRGVFRAGARRMLDALVAAYPRALTREELGHRVEITPTSGTYQTYLRDLRRNGLVTIVGDEIRASDVLFEGQ